MKILLAIDDSKFSDAVIAATIIEAKAQQGEVRVLYVVEPMPLYVDGGSPNLSDVILKAEREHAEAITEKVVERLRAARVKATSAIETGNPKSMIVDVARDWGADLVIVGSRGRTGLDRFLMGSVSEAVARHAPCSVQIVRIAKARKKTRKS